MYDVILQQLKEIEQAENVEILLAVESGSRAWGFASPDSDYDVRFIYVRPTEHYLKLEKTKDVIQLPVNQVLDINGWDLSKTLRLLHGSNPTVFEWFSSPLVYKTSEFTTRFQPVLEEYFSSKSGLWHYLSMAESNYREYLRGEMVRAKKYFYVLRPLLACRWILERGTPPPMQFSQLVGSQLAPQLLPAVNRLLELKMNAPEVKEIPRVSAINEYLDTSIAEIKERILTLPAEPAKDWGHLNALFLAELKRQERQAQ